MAETVILLLSLSLNVWLGLSLAAERNKKYEAGYLEGKSMQQVDQENPQ